MVWGRLAAACGIGSLALAVGTAAAGESAAVPGLGPWTLLPPWDAARSPSSGLVTVVLIAAYLLGVVCLLAGLRWLRVATGQSFLDRREGLVAGDAPGGDQGNFVRSGRKLVAAALLAVGACVVVPPLGSADHLSYVAYGRIAAQGGDPYVEAPSAWRDGTDPITSAVQPPWRDTPSVYGPVATGLQALAALAGHSSLRATVWAWQLIVGAAFLATGLVLHRLAAGAAGAADAADAAAARARVALLWTLNPLLLAQLVLGAHLDVLAVAFAVAAVALATRRPVGTTWRPLVAGLLLGAAVGTKITFALFALAIVWGLLRTPRAARSVALGVLGAALVLVPAHLWTGPHTYDQLHRATRSISYATGWRILADHLDNVIGADPVRLIAAVGSAVLGVLFVLLLGRRLRGHPAAVPDDATARTVRAAVVLAAAWVLTVPYALPWYDAILWAPLALLSPSLLDVAAVARLGLLALAYVPGRVVGMSELVQRQTLHFRRHDAPWWALAITAVVLAWLLWPRSGSGHNQRWRPQPASPDRPY